MASPGSHFAESVRLARPTTAKDDGSGRRVGGEGLPSIPSVVGKGKDGGEGGEAVVKDHPPGWLLPGWL